MDMLRRIGICLVLCTCLSATSARGDYVLASTDAQRDTTKQQNYEMNQIEATGEELHEGINSNGFEEPRITQDREKRRPFVPLVPHLPLYPHVRPHHGSEEPTEAIEAFHGHYSPNFLVDAPPHEKSIQSEFDHTFIEKQLRSKERGGSVELFARQSNHVECDMYSTPRYSCYNCYNYMECKDSGGKIKPCKDPLAPYCNGGVCSAVPGPQC